MLILLISIWDALFQKSQNVMRGRNGYLDPNKIYEMVSAVVDAVEKPVTVKMRMGWDEEHIFAVKNAQAVERAGGKAVALHGRTRVQMYEGKANWDIIREVKKSLTFRLLGMAMSKLHRMRNECWKKQVLTVS